MKVRGRLARYLFTEALGSILLVSGVTLSAILLVDAVEQLRSVGTRAELSLGQALQLTLLRAPKLLEQTLPFIMLTGVLFALVRLNRRSEITVMRAAGLSAWALAAPAGALALLVGVLAAGILNPVSALLQQQYEVQRNDLLGDRSRQSERFWYSQAAAGGQMMLTADRVDSEQGALTGVTLMFFALDPKTGVKRLARRVDAPTAALRNGSLELAAALEQSPGHEPARYSLMRVPTALRPSGLGKRQQSPDETPLFELPQAIHNARLAGLQPQRFEIRLHETLALPTLLAAMAVIATAFSLRLNRLGGVAAWLLLGVGAGFAAYFFGQISNALASVGAVPALAAGWGPPLAALFAACATLTTVEQARG